MPRAGLAGRRLPRGPKCNAMHILAIFLVVAVEASTLIFGGYNFSVKSGIGGPGPNLFSPDNAFVNSSTGDLTLVLTQDSATGRWGCGEVVLNHSLGFGTYSWLVEAPLESFDKGIVLGLFTYENDSREIDIELSSWDNLYPGVNADFAVQPSTVKRFWASGDILALSYTWSPGRVDFECGGVSWSHTGEDVPPPGGERVHMNLWLFRGLSPATDKGVTVLVRNFSFSPLPREGEGSS